MSLRAPRFQMMSAFALLKSSLEKTKKRDRYRIAMGPRALAASSGLAPWSMAVDLLRKRKRKIQPLFGVKGDCPLGLPPPLGERGGHTRNFHASRKNAKGFLQSLASNPCLGGLPLGCLPHWGSPSQFPPWVNPPVHDTHRDPLGIHAEGGSP